MIRFFYDPCGVVMLKRRLQTLLSMQTVETMQTLQTGIFYYSYFFYLGLLKVCMYVLLFAMPKDLWKLTMSDSQKFPKNFHRKTCSALLGKFHIY